MKKPKTRDVLAIAIEQLDKARGGSTGTEREQDAHWMVCRAQGLLKEAVRALDGQEYVVLQIKLPGVE